MLARGGSFIVGRLLRAAATIAMLGTVTACHHRASSAPPVPAGRSILFVGNSFVYGHNSTALHYGQKTVNDLNHTEMGGLAGIFKKFTLEAGLNYTVNIEAVGGQTLAWHLASRRALIDQPWDDVVLQDQSGLGAEVEGDDQMLSHAVASLAGVVHGRNPAVEVRLIATWPYPEMVYDPGGYWYGRSLADMARDIQKAYESAARKSGQVKAVIPVGDAFVGAVKAGLADGRPKAGIASSGKISLWGPDDKHGSEYGMYLESLVAFGSITGRDPTTLGPGEAAAPVLGISPDQAVALQQIAEDTLSSKK